MKNTKKALLMTLCAVMLVAASVMGTLAYLTSTDTVTNTFTVGNVVITLDEAPVDANGDKTTGDRVKANNYKLLPGHDYDKDPTIHVAEGSEDCYLFVKVTNEIAAIEDATTVADQMKAKGWTLVQGTTDVYMHERVASAEDDVVVFETIKVKGEVDNTTLAAYANKTITVVAYAIQADGFENSTPAQIWTAVGAK